MKSGCFLGLRVSDHWGCATWNLEPGTWNLEPGTWNLGLCDVVASFLLDRCGSLSGFVAVYIEIVTE